MKSIKILNIRGFNFSPRFECEFKDGNLTICDRKEEDCKNNEYLVNFFGKNINVTAIVGENGTGKSRILKLLYTLFDKSHQYDDNLVLIKNKECRNSFAIFYDDKSKEYSYIGDNSRLKCKKKIDKFSNDTTFAF